LPRDRRRVSRPLIYLGALVLLAGALAYGWSHSVQDLQPHLAEIFPSAASFQVRDGVHLALNDAGRTVGYAATGSASGYGGPMVLLVGVDTAGAVVGVEVVAERETPIFWRMVRAPTYFDGIRGSLLDEVNYEYEEVVGVTGATLSASAIVESLRSSLVEVAASGFGILLPEPSRPFEFGILEILILGLFAVGIVGHRLRGPIRRRLRWGGQIMGLVVLGFWEDSPITLAKITGILSGFMPDPRTSLAIYLLLAGFVLTSVFYGRNLYCLYACPFGAAQRVVAAIGGFRWTLPRWTVRFLGRARNVVVFAALFMAFLTLKPALASYEPFAALFSLNGTNLQWLLLFIVLVASLVLQTPWCNFLCPMRTLEIAIHDAKRWVKGPSRGAEND
jgi:hypothetical protein